MDRAAAEGIAATALGVVAGDPQRLGLFMALSGLGPETLRAAAAEPAFLLAVLDFVIGDDDLVMAVARAAEIAPERVVAARDILAGPTPG
ncbi:hypothetical protein BLTE_12900 [Blastochloris tepida]|uniref:DUF3572 domain-containing protein n=2 Tax=Blastochloris tepida TaxID=2233851 RepID=A0A348FZ72_9HYPH|nr:hypothetical protein BLTE_12900 [Blastochloris tepida]